MNFDIRTYEPTPWRARLGISALFLAIAVLFIGITLRVEYAWVKVLDVQQRAGYDMISRVVLVDTPDRPRVLVTSDPFVAVEKGGYACVSKRQFISRRWLRYGVALRGYCRSVPRPGAVHLPVPRNTQSPFS